VSVNSLAKIGSIQKIGSVY